MLALENHIFLCLSLVATTMLGTLLIHIVEILRGNPILCDNYSIGQQKSTKGFKVVILLEKLK